MAADYCFINGSVVTINDNDDIAQAVAVKGNRIIYVGSNEGVKDFIDNKTNVINLEGKSVTPGFIDCHVHPILAGFFGGAIIDITYPKCTSNKQMLEIIHEAACITPKGQWIKVWGYDQNKYSEHVHPTIEQLDAAAPEHPVQCMRICGHLGVYNTPALAKGGIYTAEDAKKFPENQLVVKDGKLTGMAKDNTNFYLWSLIDYTEEEKKDALMRSHDRLIKTGVTSIHIPGENTDWGYPLIRQYINDGKFKIRAYGFQGKITPESFKEAVGNGWVTGAGDEHFRYGACKIMLDGGTSGPSCATRKPYSHDSKLPGILNWNQDYVNNIIKTVHDGGCQMTAHAVGDKAVEMMLDGYEYAFRNNPGTKRRHRIEHCALTDEGLVKRIKELGIIPVSNPHFLVINASDYHKYYGERAEHMFDMRAYLDAGIKAVIGCDAPTGGMEVMKGIDAAVNRTDRGTGEVVGKDAAISMLEAIRCYTLNGAYASFEENIKGSIEVGKLADLVVLSENILEYPKEKVQDINILMTMIDGKTEYINDIWR